ncbi:MAG: DNA polymerase, partial [Chloroflexota bacterium]|nr:DNA polymerase [Chloroflexota bacterium]
MRTRGGRAITVTPPAPSPALTEDEQLDLAQGAGDAAGAGATPTHAYVVDTQATLDDLLARLRRRGRFAIDLETDALNPIEAGIVGISVAAEPGIAYYIPVGHAQGTQLPCDEVLDRLRPLLEDESVEKTAHNAKFDLTVLARHGVDVRGLTFDTMIAAYLLNPSGRGYGLKDLVLAHFNVEMTDIIALIGKGKEQITMAGVDIHKAADYAAADADMTLRLQEILAPQLHEKGLYDLFRDVEMPLVSVLTAMEIAGMDVDAPYLREMSVRVQGDMDRLMAQVHEAVGHPFNIASPKQLSAVLFEELGLPSQKKTSTGYSTDAEVLETLRGKHPAVDGILEYRQLAKLKGTYLDGLPELISPIDGRIHTSFNQTMASTGRLSSSNPNLQNIPIRTDLGRTIRRAFVVKGANEVLLAADYSQI